MDLTNITKKELLEQLSNNQNLCTPRDICKKIDEGVVTECDLEDAGIPAEIIPHIFSYSPPDLDSKTSKNPDKIKDSGILEVYFWGLATSGKTCALAGILRTIWNDKHFQSSSQCYNEAYLQSLMNNVISDKNIAYFPCRTITENIRYMNFNFKTMEENEVEKWSWGKFKYITVKEKQIENRKIAFIDLSGDLIRSIYHNEIKKESSNFATINTLKTLLHNDNNRKIHFFFIDYDEHTKEMNQEAKLEKLMAIFKREKYFDKTDYIYVVITKSDLFKKNDGLPCAANQRKTFAINYFNEKCGSLPTNLYDICTDKRGKGINYNKDRKVVLDDFILDFSMGDVYFKYLCKFNPASAKEIIKILKEKVNTTDKTYG
jgi:hypothetical protein